MTIVDPDQLSAEVRQRLHAQLDQRARRRQRTAALRSELARCRAAGKAARHRRRLAQMEARLREATLNGTDDSWWEEPE